MPGLATLTGPAAALLQADINTDTIAPLVRGHSGPQPAGIRSEAELAQRQTSWAPPTPPLDSGYWKLYIDHVLQADQGADLDFLVGRRGAFVPKDNH